MPITTPSMIRQEAMPVHSSSTAPSNIASFETSPMLPGIWPRNACIQENCAVIASSPPLAPSDSAVAPLIPSTPIELAPL